MEIHLDKKALKHIRLSAADAIEEGDTETLREDIHEAFSEEQVEEIERRLDHGDFFEFLTDVLDEWGGDDADELFELLETQLGELGVDLKFEARPDDDDEDEDIDLDDDDDEDDDDDLEEEEEDDEPLAGAATPRRLASVAQPTRPWNRAVTSRRAGPSRTPGKAWPCRAS